MRMATYRAGGSQRGIRRIDGPYAYLKLQGQTAERMAERGIAKDMIETAIAKGQRLWDPKNGTVAYVLEDGFASGKGLLVSTNPITGYVTTVIRGTDVVRSRFVPLPYT
jgi:hypothetical protein